MGYSKAVPQNCKLNLPYYHFNNYQNQCYAGKYRRENNYPAVVGIGAFLTFGVFLLPVFLSARQRYYADAFYYERKHNRHKSGSRVAVRKKEIDNAPNRGGNAADKLDNIICTVKFFVVHNYTLLISSKVLGV